MALSWINESTKWYRLLVQSEEDNIKVLFPSPPIKAENTEPEFLELCLWNGDVKARGAAIRLYLHSITEPQIMLSWKVPTKVTESNSWLQSTTQNLNPKEREHCPNASWTSAFGAVLTVLGSLFYAGCPPLKKLSLTPTWSSPDAADLWQWITFGCHGETSPMGGGAIVPTGIPAVADSHTLVLSWLFSECGVSKNRTKNISWSFSSTWKLKRFWYQRIYQQCTFCCPKFLYVWCHYRQNFPHVNSCYGL